MILEVLTLTSEIRASTFATMTFPDWTSSLNEQFSNWLAWSTLETIVTVTVGAMVVLIVASMLIRIFVH